MKTEINYVNNVIMSFGSCNIDRMREREREREREGERERVDIVWKLKFTSKATMKTLRWKMRNL